MDHQQQRGWRCPDGDTSAAVGADGELQRVVVGMVSQLMGQLAVEVRREVGQMLNTSNTTVQLLREPLLYTLYFEYSASINHTVTSRTTLRTTLLSIACSNFQYLSCYLHM